MRNVNFTLLQVSLPVPTFCLDRTYCRKICPGLNVVGQVSYSPWNLSWISFLELATTLIRNTTARLFHETDSGRIQNPVLLKAIECLKFSQGCGKILATAFGSWQVTVITEKFLRYNTSKEVKHRKLITFIHSILNVVWSQTTWTKHWATEDGLDQKYRGLFEIFCTLILKFPGHLPLFLFCFYFYTCSSS